MKQFDIFISCKTEDIKDAEKIYDYLSSRSYSVFLYTKSVGRLGNADYRKTIDFVLDHCNHFILFTNNNEYVLDSWVEYEWGTFCNEKRSGRKKGNLIVIVGDKVSWQKLPIALRNNQILRFNTFSDDLLNYMEGENQDWNIQNKPEKNILLRIWEYQISVKAIASFLFILIACYNIYAFADNLQREGSFFKAPTINEETVNNKHGETPLHRLDSLKNKEIENAQMMENKAIPVSFH